MLTCPMMSSWLGGCVLSIFNSSNPQQVSLFLCVCSSNCSVSGSGTCPSIGLFTDITSRYPRNRDNAVSIQVIC